MLVGATSVGPWEIILLLFFFLGLSLPAFIVGKRRGVSAPGVAFVPFFGPWIVILWSIDRTGWMVLITLIPLASRQLATAAQEASEQVFDVPRLAQRARSRVGRG